MKKILIFILTCAAVMAKGQCPTAYDSSRVRNFVVDYLADGSTRKKVRRKIAKKIIAVVPVFKAEQKGFHNNEVDTIFFNSFSPDDYLFAALVKLDSIVCMYVALDLNGKVGLDYYPTGVMPEWRETEFKLRSSGKCLFVCSTFRSVCYFEKNKLMLYNGREKKYTSFEEYYPEYDKVRQINRR